MKTLLLTSLSLVNQFISIDLSLLCAVLKQ